MLLTQHPVWQVVKHDGLLPNPWNLSQLSLQCARAGKGAQQPARMGGMTGFARCFASEKNTAPDSYISVFVLLLCSGPEVHALALPEAQCAAGMSGRAGICTYTHSSH